MSYRIVVLSDRIPPESVGGAGRIAWELARGLSQAGHELYVVAATRKVSFRETREGISTYHLHTDYRDRWRGYYSVYNPQTVPALRRLLAELQPDVVNAHNVHGALSYHSLALADRHGAAVVLTAHDVMSVAYGKLIHYVRPQRGEVINLPQAYRLPRLHNLRDAGLRFNPLRTPLVRRIQRRHTHARTAVSEALRQALEVNGLPPYRVVYNGLDPASLDAAPETVERLRNRYGLTGRPVILFGGRLSKQKGGGRVLEAMNRLVVRWPEAALLVLARRKITRQRLARYPNLDEQHVVNGGWLEGEELAAAFHLADVVTVASTYLDPLPTINLEAMAAGRPLVTTCFGGSPELVVDGETGYVVNPFDTEAYAGRLESLLADSDLRARMGAAARQRFEERFTLDRQVAEMVAVFEEAIAIKREASRGSQS